MVINGDSIPLCFFLEVTRRELAGVWIASWTVWIATFRQFRPQAVLRSGERSEVP